MSENKLAQDFDPAEWQWQDKSGNVFKIEELTRDDLLQVVCACMSALEDAEAACVAQMDIFASWRKGCK